jgi:hypothetical protein
MKGDFMKKDTKDVKKPSKEKTDRQQPEYSPEFQNLLDKHPWLVDGMKHGTKLKDGPKVLIMQPAPLTPAQTFADNLHKVVPFPVRVLTGRDLERRRRDENRGWRDDTEPEPMADEAEKKGGQEE